MLLWVKTNNKKPTAEAVQMQIREQLLDKYIFS